MPGSKHLFKRNISYPLAMESPVDLDIYVSTADAKESDDMYRTAKTMSVESLNTLLNKLPEISIPATLHNPLPLQCLAANALPDGVREEIDGVIAQYSGRPVSTPSAASEDNDGSSTDLPVSECADSVKGSSAVEKDIDTLTAALHKALGIEEIVSPSSSFKQVVPVSKLTIHRETEGESPTGFGLKLCGGVKCDNCNSLHSIVTGVSPSLYETEEITEGLCVVEWNGCLLDGCTYEEVQRVVSSTDTQVNQIEVSVKKCSKNLLITRGGFDWLPSFAAVRLNKRKNAIFQYEDESDHKHVYLDEPAQTTSHSSLEASLAASHERLDLRRTSETSSPPSTYSRSPSPSPSPFEPKKSLEVTIPQSDEVTQALSASMENRPKSPNPNNLGSIINRLPNMNGMVQLCLDYNNEFQELNISLLQAKGQSNKEINDTSDVFINTYLVPDHKSQGVRSIHIKKDNTEYHNSSYMMSPAELSSIALRVILFDAHKSKNIVFRGEVLLGLSDQQIVNLDSEPTWYTLCPADPNLSKLPPPVHHKHKLSMENLLQKLKQKAHSLTTVRYPLLKTSSLLTSEMKSISMLSLPGSYEKRSQTLFKKKSRQHSPKTYSGSFEPELMDYVMESESRAGEADRLEKLSSIIDVLREDRKALVEEGGVKDTKSQEPKNNKLASMLTVLQDSTSPKNGLYGDTTCSTLDRRPRPKSKTTAGEDASCSKRSSVPDIRRSFKEKSEHGESFFNELEKLIDQQSHRLRSTSTESEGAEHRAHQREQIHYKLVDSCQSEDELDSPSTTKSRSSWYQNSKSNDFLSYPAEVSLHRINIEDVDKKDEKNSKKKSCTMPVLRTVPQSKPRTFLPPLGVTDKRPPKPPKKLRSKSFGDMENLGSEEELFIVRSPQRPRLVSNHSVDPGSIDDLDTIEPLPVCTSELSDGLTSLDFGDRTEEFSSEPNSTVNVEYMLDSDHPDGEEEPAPRKKGSMFKWKSLEDILGPKQRKTKEKKSKSRKTSLLSVPGRGSSGKRNSAPESGSSSSGNVRLELQYNNLNPAHPVLMVKLADLVLTSMKGLSSDLMMKCYVNHMSTGVCILKDKTPVILKNSSSTVPLAILQFETDIANLSVQVQICGGTKLFSRKVIGQASVDLTSLDLSRGSVCSQWFILSKATHA